ncbi:EF-hand calcium-binding domain-containing protein 14-like [Pseudophryne corroboree]|uniref:EF-hand calcium-binding domain-containing protein 14-like n=1 Tax=Pseudophryne corroboree TaxID=495146 RepID=UPI003081DDA0
MRQRALCIDKLRKFSKVEQKKKLQGWENHSKTSSADNMDVLKQENYALLHDESDVEEYDRNNAATVKSQGKSHITRFTDNVTWTQPLWVCHTTFIVVLILSQVALCIFVLKEQMHDKTSKLEQETLQNNTFGMNSPDYHIDNGNSLTFENRTQMNDDLKMEQLQQENHSKDANILKRVHTIETNIKSIKKIVSSQGEDIKALMAHQQADRIKYEKVMERQFNNKTTALNSLQNRLEEGLDLVFSQISQLRDDVYFIENALNQTKQERLGENETVLKPAKRGFTVPPVTDPQQNASQEMSQEIKTTVQPISKQKDESGEVYHISTSLLKSRADFQIFFYGADKDADGYLTYDEIKNIFGEEALSKELLQHVGGNQDRMYSYIELMRMFSLKD